MPQSAQIVDIFDRLARRFEDEVETDPNCSQVRGWGQFLKMERSHFQIGLYGTASGLITLQLADRGSSATVKQALNTLQLWWKQRQDVTQQPGQWFLQTLRVAYLYMALDCLTDDSATSLRKEVGQSLWDTQLPGGQWGNYWQSREEHDQTPRVLTTAVVIIAFLIFQKADRKARERLTKAAEWLESKVVSGIELAPLPRIAAITALVALYGEHVSRDVRKAANRVARRADPELGDLGVYFCNFRYRSKHSEKQWGRDYFIVPRATLLAIGGFLPNAPTFLRLRAERILDSLVRNLDRSDFLYRPEPDRAPATKDNAWFALLLRLADNSRQNLGLQKRFVYSLLRERAPSVWGDRVFPITSILLITGLAALLRDVSSLLVQICVSLGALIVGLICRPYIAKLLRRSR